MQARLRVCGAITAMALVAFAYTPLAHAEETRIDVRVISKGAKFVGSSMGGVAVTIEDAMTGELLAKGVVAGGTGDTAKIMKNEALPHAPLSTPDAAVYKAAVDIDEPTKVKITADGPLAQVQAAATVSVTQWVLPGKPIIGGDGVLLELPGFVVDILAPPAAYKTAPGKKTISIRANVTMMCGCPVEPGGLWDADRFEIAATVTHNGDAFAEIPLTYAGESSQFEGSLDVENAGVYEICVYAFDVHNGNTGVDKTTVVLKE